jgi:hypothetical protein
VSLDFERDRTERSGRDGDRLVFAIERAADDAADTQQRAGPRAITQHDARGFVRTPVYITRRALDENRNVAVVLANDEIDSHRFPR